MFSSVGDENNIFVGDDVFFSNVGPQPLAFNKESRKAAETEFLHSIILTSLKLAEQTCRL
jgi:hypothetical protein